MIRHICMFKLKEENREQNTGRALKLADELLKPIDLLRGYAVVTNSKNAPESNYELSLIFDFDTMEDLIEYQKHPNHIEFGNFIKSVRTDRACIDYEI